MIHLKPYLLSLLMVILSALSLCAQRLDLQLPPEAVVAKGVFIQTYRNGLKSTVVPMQKGETPNTYSYVFPDNQPAGVYELVVDRYRPMPFVVHGQADIVSRPSLAQLQGYAVAGSDPENDALAYFLGHQANWVARQSTWRETVSTAHTSSDTVAHDPAALLHWVTEFVTYRNEMNAHMDTLRQRYPTTYVATYMASLYKTPFTLENTPEATLAYLHQHFFDGWNLTSVAALHNPAIMSELDLYYSYFGEKEEKLYDGMANLLTRPEVKGNPLLTEPLVDMVSLILLKNHHARAEEYALYMGETYSETCGLAPTGQRNTLPERIKRMQTGAQFPNLNLNLFERDSRISLNTIYSRQPYTLLYFWQSSCPHCLAVEPAVAQVTASNADKLHTVAVAIDQNRDGLASYLETLKKMPRNRNKNWTECWEKGELTNEQLNKLYLRGTPTFVLLNQQGEVLTTSARLDDITIKLKQGHETNRIN